MFLVELHVDNMQISVDTYVQSVKCACCFSLVSVIDESGIGTSMDVEWGGGCTTTIFCTEYSPAQLSGQCEGRGC